MSTNGNLYIVHLEALWLLFFIPVLLFIFWRSYRRNVNDLRILLENTRVLRTYIILFVLWSVITVSLVGIAAQFQHNVYAIVSGSPRGDYIFLVDVSSSMAARVRRDGPDNLSTAKAVMRTVTVKIPNARYQVFGFSRLAFPLSQFENSRTYLDDVLEYGIYLNIVPGRGSEIVNALAVVAREKLGNTNYERARHVILFSDGVSTHEVASELIEALRLLKESGLTLSVVGMGSTSGQQLAFTDALGNPTGETKTFYLQESSLRNIAAMGGGQYFPQEDTNGLVRYLRTTLEPVDDGDVIRKVIARENVIWPFLITFFISLFVLFLNRKRFY